MAKIRVHELAKELNITSKEILGAIAGDGSMTHMSALDDDQVAKIRKQFAPAKPEVKKETAKPSGKARLEPGQYIWVTTEGKVLTKVPTGADGKPVNVGPDGKPLRQFIIGENRKPIPIGANGKPMKKVVKKQETPEKPAENQEAAKAVKTETPAENKTDMANTENANKTTDNKPVQKSENREGGKNNDNRNDNRNRNNRNGDNRNENRNGERKFNNRGDRNEHSDGNRDRRNDNREGGRDGNRNFNQRNNDNRDRRNNNFGDRDNRRNDDGRDGKDGREGRDNRSQGTGRRKASMPAEPINAKETRNGKENRHTINREHSKDKDNDRKSEGGNKNAGRNRRNNNPEIDERNQNGKKKPNKKQQNTPAPAPRKQEPKEETIKNITIPDPVSLKDLADAMKVTPAMIIKKLFLGGKMVTINTEFSFEEAEEIALDYNCIAEKEVVVDAIEEILKETEESPELLKARPPVVCVMGHVDHGKTSLLDCIRSTHVTAGEAGGITQHIGAYVVDINGQKITFLDTPGHEAFTSMRLRGAQATDIAVLVVAADDGVMPQTIEAISHAKAAGVEVIVAVNKIDKEGANVQRVKQELTEYGLIAEDWGGSTVFVPVSAKTGEGIDELLEMICLTAEVLELKANPDRKARGLVIEAKLDKGRGPVATILIQKGTLKIGDSISIGHTFGHVRAMIDDKGGRVKVAGPSVPVEILGLNDVPFSGEVMMAHDTEKEARATADAFIAYGREKMLEETKSKLSLDDLFDQIKAGNVKELNLVVKADVQGSVEAVKQSLTKLSNDEVLIKVIHGGVGAINESDVTLASASNAIIIGFNIRPDAMAKSLAEREKVDMRLYRVIYNAIEDIEAAMKGMLDPEFAEKVTGHLDVRQIYKASGVGTIAGCYVTDGMVQRSSQVRIVRDGIVIYEGTLASLKRFKDDVKEVKSGFECGLVFERFNDIKEGDQVEAFVMEEIPR